LLQDITGALPSKSQHNIDAISRQHVTRKRLHCLEGSIFQQCVEITSGVAQNWFSEALELALLINTLLGT
jgi:hypothetical protein